MDKKNSVLIVDDEIQNITVLSHILKADYTVYAVRKGTEALAAAEKHSPDIILLDIIMPETDGYAVFTELRASEKAKDIPVIFITGLGDATSEEKGLLLGAADYIAKPFSPGIVKLRIQNQIKIINLQRELEDALAIIRRANQ